MLGSVVLGASTDLGDIDEDTSGGSEMVVVLAPVEFPPGDSLVTC